MTGAPIKPVTIKGKSYYVVVASTDFIAWLNRRWFKPWTWFHNKEVDLK